MNKGKTNKNANLGSLLKIAGQNCWKLATSGIFAVISAILALAPFLFIYLVMIRVIDNSFGPPDYDYIWQMGIYAVAAVFARYVALFISTMFSHFSAFDLLYGIRIRLASHLGELPMGYFNNKNAGYIKKIISEDVEAIENFVAHHIPDFVAGIALPILTVGFLFWIDWRMALVALIPLPMALNRQAKMREGVTKDNLMEKYHSSMENMHSVIIEYVRGMPVIKIFNQTVESFSRFEQSVYAFRDFTNAWTRRAAPPWASFTVIINSSLFFLLPIGVWFYLQGTLELPTLLLFLMLGSGYMVPLLKTAMMGGTLQQILGGVGRIEGVLSEVGLPDAIIPQKPKNHSIAFNNVGFAYGEKQVLDSVSFAIPEGSVTALVGPSGAGKTTIAHLIARMWDVKQGEITIGGVNIKDIAYADLMDRIGFVFQDVFIFSDTVYENIRMGAQEVTREDVIRAAKAAQCHEFIEKLPQGYDTVIGEGGSVHLSGGERQRVSLARIILKDAPIILLDEATAYADSENEQKIQNAFAKIMKGKTVIVIAHRLSTITDADQILVVNKGRLVEQGTHPDLLETRGLYYNMWDAHITAQHWTFTPNGAE